MTNAAPRASLASPARFASLAGWLAPLLGVAALVAFAVGLCLAFTAPADYQQGEAVRIMFVHVPAAWLSMGVYAAMTAAALGTLVWRHPLADVAARALLPVGAALTLLCLVTGSLWGRPMWGTWWVWDARLTSVLILFLTYLGLLALHRAVDDPGRAARAGAVLTLAGAVNLPIVKFSVDWWNSLHQPASVLRLGGPAIHPDILRPLLVMGLAYALLVGFLALTRMRAELARRRLRRLGMEASAPFSAYRPAPFIASAPPSTDRPAAA